VSRALIGGVGNVLLGDDGFGPYVVQLLDSLYSFAGNVEIADLGTPALDLTHRIVGLDLLILVDSIAASHPPGTLLVYNKEDILRAAPAQRFDPHSPALSECLMTADMLGASPTHVLLVGVVGKNYESGLELSAPVCSAVEPAVNTILDELKRMGFACEKKSSPSEHFTWWGAQLEEITADA
jgi:hydrogenase maturation protease